MKFKFGHVVTTPGAFQSCAGCGVNLNDLFNRHGNGDWGDLDEDDKNLNERALTSDDRILSRYDLPNGEAIYIITEGDRSATTALLTSEY